MRSKDKCANVAHHARYSMGDRERNRLYSLERQAMCRAPPSLSLSCAGLWGGRYLTVTLPQNACARVPRLMLRSVNDLEAKMRGLDPKYRQKNL